MSSELSADGKGAVLNAKAVSTTDERQRARRKAADLALQEADPHQALRDVLDALKLHPAEGEPR